MKTQREIEMRIAQETEPIVIEALRWVLKSSPCPFCELPNKKQLEIQLRNREIGPNIIEVRNGWPEGTCDEHMDNHLTYDPDEATHIEQMRAESINTLDMAESLVVRLVGWLDELEVLKASDGISSEWVSDATKLVAQANTSLKLVGQLKKEIGVDSQLLLAENRMNDFMRLLVGTLEPHPELLDQVELHMSALRAPTYVMDTSWTEDDS
jgi:hypothetical protein